MYKCNCGDTCAIITTYRKSEKDKSHIQTVQILKCNRLLGENSKKKPCNYYEENIIKESVYQIPECTYVTSKKHSVKKQKRVTYSDIYKLVNELLNLYDTPGINYFGKLNDYLRILGYSVHEPLNETLKELKLRLSKPPIKKKNVIYMNLEAFLSKAIEDTEYNFETEIYHVFFS